MDLPHKRGERVTIYWPDGLYDFVIEYHQAEPVTTAGWEDWLVIRGLVVEPEGVKHRTTRSFHVHPVDGGYALLPMQKT